MKFRDKKKSKRKLKELAPPAEETVAKERGDSTPNDLIDFVSEIAEAKGAHSEGNNSTRDDSRLAENAENSLIGFGGNSLSGSRADDCFGVTQADDVPKAKGRGLDEVVQRLGPLLPPAVEVLQHEDGTLQLGDLYLNR